MNVHWLAAVAAVCQVSGSTLILWGLKLVPVSSPFTLFVRDPGPEEVEKRPVPAGTTREHPWAVTWGAVLLLVGLAFAVVAGVLARR